MRTAGVTQPGGPVVLLELPGPVGPGPGEVLLDVRAGGVGNRDEFVRTGGWDTGIRPPMTLGVEAAGRVAAVGDGVAGIAPGDAVTTHSLPLRGQGSWAEQHLAAAEQVAPIPPGVSWDAAAALPVPALTASQALAALDIQPGQSRAGTRRGRGDRGRRRCRGEPGPVRRQRRDAGGPGRWPAAHDHRRPAGGGREVAVTSITVVPDGPRLRMLTGLLGQGTISITVAGWYPLEQAGKALAQARHGIHGAALVLQPAAQDSAGPGVSPLATPGEGRPR